MAAERNRIPEWSRREMETLRRRRRDAYERGDLERGDRLDRRLRQMDGESRQSRSSSIPRRDYNASSEVETFQERRRPRVVTPPGHRDRRRARDLAVRDRGRTTPDRANFASPWRLPSPPGAKRNLSKSRKKRIARSTQTDPKKAQQDDDDLEFEAIRKNRPLSQWRPPKSARAYAALYSDVPPPPEPGETGYCPQCYERNESFSTEQNLKNHWITTCPCLTRCEYCDQVIHVGELNDHQLVKCPFVKGAMLPCPMCGLAQYQGDPNHPRCPRKIATAGSTWCPLCAKNVRPSNSVDAWRNHLIDRCLFNARNKNRWTAAEAPTQGASLLTGLNGQPSPLFSTGPPPPPVQNAAPVTGQPTGQRNAPINLNGDQAENEEKAEGNQLRAAYRMLQEQRKDEYTNQKQRDKNDESSEEDDI